MVVFEGFYDVLSAYVYEDEIEKAYSASLDNMYESINPKGVFALAETFGSSYAENTYQDFIVMVGQASLAGFII